MTLHTQQNTTKANKTTNNHWKNKNKNKSNFFITHNSNPLLLPQPRSLRAPAAGAGAEANCNAFVSIPKTAALGHRSASLCVADMRMASMHGYIWHCAHQFTVWLPADIDACVFGSGAGAPHRPNTSPGPAVIRLVLNSSVIMLSPLSKLPCRLPRPVELSQRAFELFESNIPERTTHHASVCCIADYRSFRTAAGLQWNLELHQTPSHMHA